MTEINIIYNETTIVSPLINKTITLEYLGAQEICDKIFIGDLLNYIETEKIVSTLMQIKSKLKAGGTLVIEEYDQMEVCLAVVNDRITSVDFNNIIKHKFQLLSLPDLYDLFGRTGFQILSKDIDNLRHYLEVKSV